MPGLAVCSTTVTGRGTVCGPLAVPQAAAPLWGAAGAALHSRALPVNLKGCRLLALTWHDDLAAGLTC